jgi:hypothetical protein
MGVDSHKTGPADWPDDTRDQGSSGETGPQRDEGTPAGDVARAERLHAQIEERQVTPDLRAIAAETGGRLLGLEHNIKSQDSLERKITQSDKEPTDVLRYTMAFSHDHIADGAAAAMASLRADGYRIVSVENKWLDPTPGEYRGINATVESRTGYKFELQFHTPESFAVKEAGTHDLYEITRDKDQPHADRDEAELAGRLYSSTLLVPPPDIERITPVSST